MGVTITQEHIDMAVKAGACSVSGIKVGASFSSLTRPQLEWFESKFPEQAAEIANESLKSAGFIVFGDSSLVCVYGDGYGYGYGYG